MHIILIFYGSLIFLRWGVERDESKQGLDGPAQEPRGDGQQISRKRALNPLPLRKSPQFRLLSAGFFGHQHRPFGHLLRR